MFTCICRNYIQKTTFFIQRLIIDQINSNLTQMIHSDSDALYDAIQRHIKYSIIYDISLHVCKLNHSNSEYQQLCFNKFHLNPQSSRISQYSQKSLRMQLKPIQKFYKNTLAIYQQRQIDLEILHFFKANYPATLETISISKMKTAQQINNILYHTLYYFRSVHKIVLTNNQIDKLTLFYFRQSKWDLAELTIANCDFVNSSLRSLQFLDLSKLKRAEIKFQSLSNGQLKDLSKLEMPSLQNCSLFFNNLTKDGLKILQKCAWPNLNIINLSQNLVCAQVVREIGGSLFPPKQQLIFTSNRTSNNSFWFYNQIAKLPLRCTKLNFSPLQRTNKLRISDLQVPESSVQIINKVFDDIDAY